MHTIHKYPLEIAASQRVLMPFGAKPLSVQVKGGQVCLWAQVEDTLPKASHMVWCRGTGNDCTSIAGTKHIGTVQIGEYVWHFFWEE